MFQLIADTLVYDWMALNASEHWVEALHFFIYDSLKIGFLVIFVILDYFLNRLRK